MMKERHSYKESSNRPLILLITVFILFVVFYFFGTQVSKAFMDLSRIKQYILSFGVFAPLVFMLIQILQVLVAPIPGQVVGIASGYIFGITMGTVYSMIGVMAGSMLAIFLARKLGRPFVEKFVDKKLLKKFDRMMEKKGVLGIFLIMLLPVLPDDAVCLASGLTKIPYRALMIIIFLGRLPGFVVLNMVGSGFADEKSLVSNSIFIGVAVVSSMLLYIFRGIIKKAL